MDLMFRRFDLSHRAAPVTAAAGLIVALLVLGGCDGGSHGIDPCYYSTASCSWPDIGLRYYQAGDFSEGLAAVQLPDRKYAVIDTSGAVRFTSPFAFDISSWYDERTAFHEGLIVCRKDSLYDSRYGLLDAAGAVVLPPTHRLIRAFSEGRALAQAYDSKRYGFLDRTGAWAIAPQYLDAGDFSEGLARVKALSDQYGYIDPTGAFVIPAQYASAGQFSEGLAPVQSWDARWSFIDKSGNVVLTLDRSIGECHPFSEGLAAVKQRDSSYWSYIDLTGTRVTPLIEAWDVHDFHDGLACLGGGVWSGIQYIDRSGARQFRAASGTDFTNGYAATGTICSCSGRLQMSLVNKAGVSIHANTYESISRYGEGWFAVVTGGYAGFVNVEGKILGSRRE
jgi:hypothetical protein